MSLSIPSGSPSPPHGEQMTQKCPSLEGDPAGSSSAGDLVWGQSWEDGVGRDFEIKGSKQEPEWKSRQSLKLPNPITLKRGRQDPENSLRIQRPGLLFTALSQVTKAFPITPGPFWRREGSKRNWKAWTMAPSRLGLSLSPDFPGMEGDSQAWDFEF